MRQPAAALQPRARFQGVVVCLAISAWAILTAAGCATTDEGDIPWNAPQPWEGAPVIPGMNN